MANPIYIIKRLFNMNYKSFFDRISLVSKKTNKGKFAIFCDMVWCGIKYGAGYMDYDVIGFYKLSPEQRKTILTRGKNNKFVKELNEKEYWHIFNNKNEFNEMFAKFLKRDWIYPASANKEKTLAWINNHPVFFAKPNSGQCGKGIEKIETSKWNIDELYSYIVSNGLELLEEPIKQHNEMNKLNSSSVNTIRMVTVMNKQGDVTILATFSRIGNGKVVDNFNSGGMTARINRETGVIEEEAVNKAGTIFEKHPITGTTIKGFQIPCWDEARNLVKEAARLSEHVRYVGWDVAITTDGPVLVEGNHYPGHDIYQVAEKMDESSIGVLPEFEEAILVRKSYYVPQKRKQKT